MAMTKAYRDPSNDPGEVFEIGTDPDTRKMVKARVRQIPDEVERELSRAPRKQEVKFRRGLQTMEVDTERSRETARRRAAFALMDTENYEALPGDQGAVQEFQAHGFADAAVGVPVRMDGRWTDDVKAWFLGSYGTDLVTAVLDYVDKLGRRTLEAREELEKNS
jgi:microsomal dipeptidase-like Zn-dependent dipeptidase